MSEQSGDACTRFGLSKFHMFAAVSAGVMVVVWPLPYIASIMSLASHDSIKNPWLWALHRLILYYPLVLGALVALMMATRRIKLLSDITALTIIVAILVACSLAMSFSMKAFSYDRMEHEQFEGDHDQALIQAIKNDDVAYVRHHIESGHPIAFSGNLGTNPLHSAITLERWQIIELLVKAGMDPNFMSHEFDWFGPVHLISPHEQQAVMDARLKCMRLLLEAGLKPDTFNRHRTLMHMAVHDRSIDMLKLLLEYHPDPAVRDANGITLLESAVQWGHWECASFLVERVEKSEYPSAIRIMNELETRNDRDLQRPGFKSFKEKILQLHNAPRD